MSFPSPRLGRRPCLSVLPTTPLCLRSGVGRPLLSSVVRLAVVGVEGVASVTLLWRV